MSDQPPFPVKAGDSITYINSHGFQTGYFVRWNNNGAAVIKKPAGGRVTMEPHKLRPCNDGRMVRLRGFIEWRPPPDPATPAPTATKRKK